MRGSVRRRITWIVTLTALLPLLIAWGSALLISYNTQTQAAQKQQEAQAALIVDSITRFVDELESQLRIFADTLARSSDPHTIGDAELSALVLSSPAFSQMGLYAGSGQRQASGMRVGPLALPDSLAGTPLFIQAQSGRVVYGDPPALAAQSLPLAPAEVPRLRIAVPFQVGISEQMMLVGDVSMDQFWNLTGDLERATGSQIYVLTAAGVLISATHTQVLIDQPPLRDQPLFQGASSTATYENVFGAQVVGVRAAIDPPGWTLLVEHSADEIYGAIERMALSLLAVILVALPVVVGSGMLAGRRLARPIQQLHTSVDQFTHNPASYEPANIQTGDELTALSAAFNTMASGLNQSRAQLLRANEDLETLVATRTGELQHALQDVQRRSQEQELLLETVRRLSMPVIPIVDGMVVMPLVGEFGAARAEEIIGHLLAAIEREQARVVLVDITGVPVVDADVAQALLRAHAAARLLGTRVILAGVRPETAETLVSLGLDLGDLRTAATLKQAFLLGISELPQARRRPAPPGG